MALPIHSNEALLEWLKGKEGRYMYIGASSCLLAKYYQSKYGKGAGVNSTHSYVSWTGGGGVRLPPGWDALAKAHPWTYEAARERLERLMAG